MGGYSIPTAIAKRPKFGLIFTLALVIAGLVAVDRFLERVEVTDVESRARDFYNSGVQDLIADKPDDAVEVLRNAHALLRENTVYELELVTALTKAGKFEEANPLIDEVLQKEPNDGGANLIAAQLMLAQGRQKEAEGYFHRAIYGTWRNDGREHRVAARLELVDLLETTNQREELTAELISLDADTAGDPAMQPKLAKLFLAAGSPARASAIYRAIIARTPKDGEAHAGLGQAELEQGNYRTARSAFTEAFFLLPNDAYVRSRLQLLNTVSSLDPTIRQLSSAEKYRRSLQVLNMARDSIAGCTTGAKDGLLSEVDAAEAGKAPQHPTNEESEQLLELAERIWKARVSGCGSIPAREEPLKLIMERLAG